MAQQPVPEQQGSRYESDIKKIVHRHLSDPNHRITDEELASIRIGITPTPSEGPGTGFESQREE